MTDADARLKAMFAADVPPAMDARFRLDALERIERRRMRGRLALLALAGGAVTVAAVALCLAEDYSHAEAAEILGLPLGTVKSQVLRGRARLLEVLEVRS